MDTKTRSASPFDLDAVVAGLRAERERWRASEPRPREPGARELPSRDALVAIVDGLRGALFPMRLGPPDLRPDSEDYYVGHTLDTVLTSLAQQIKLELRYFARVRNHAGPNGTGAPASESNGCADEEARVLTRDFAAALPAIRRLLDGDVQAAYDGDPAARSVDEVLLCYPGIEAMIHHRIGHQLYAQGLTLLARMISEHAHAQTGIDIHPGAHIGAGFFIDHGTGVVIGETAIVGERVRLYQHVTLGAKRFPVDSSGKLAKDLPRHPIVEDDVVIYAGATILGRVTIGRGSTVGGNVWLTRSLPPESHIAQARMQLDGAADPVVCQDLPGTEQTPAGS